MVRIHSILTSPQPEASPATPFFTFLQENEGSPFLAIRGVHVTIRLNGNTAPRSLRRYDLATVCNDLRHIDVIPRIELEGWFSRRHFQMQAGSGMIKRHGVPELSLSRVQWDSRDIRVQNKHIVNRRALNVEGHGPTDLDAREAPDDTCWDLVLVIDFEVLIGAEDGFGAIYCGGVRQIEVAVLKSVEFAHHRLTKSVRSDVKPDRFSEGKR